MFNETVQLTASEEKELLSRAQSRTLPAGEVRRARLLLLYRGKILKIAVIPKTKNSQEIFRL